MSNWTQTVERMKVDVYNCQYCGAVRYESCKTKSGKRATYTHARRGDELQQLVWELVEEGYREGEYYAERKAKGQIGTLTSEIERLQSILALNGMTW